MALPTTLVVLWLRQRTLRELVDVRGRRSRGSTN